MPDATPTAWRRPVNAANSASNAVELGTEQVRARAHDAGDRLGQLGFERLRPAGEVDDGNAVMRRRRLVGGHRYHCGRAR